MAVQGHGERFFPSLALEISLTSIVGFEDWDMPAALATTKLFIVAGMIHDLATRRRVHSAWWVGLGVSIALEGGALLIVGTPLETPVAQAIASFAGVFGWMY
jgi:hypothetical protein